MTRNLKTMGLALLCLPALGLVGAQGASAAVNHSFTSGSVTGTTVLTGTTEPGMKEVFKLTTASFSCEDIAVRGTMVGRAVDHISVVPIFTSGACSAGALGAATIHNNGCTWTYDSDTAENTTHFPAGQEHANVSIACGHTGNITIAAGGCTITIEDTHSPNIPVNQNLPGMRYELAPNHSGGKTALTDTWTVRTLKATTSGANCILVGLGNPGTHSNGTWEGKTTITCYEDPKTYNPHTESATEGALVNCGVSTP